MTQRTILPYMVIAAALMLIPSSCAFVSKELKTGGEEQLVRNPPPAHKVGPHVLIFAMDGACPAQFMDAVHSGRALHLASILGQDQGKGLFEHAYAAPHALSILPSSTIADWVAIFTGSVPGYDGIPGDEWFERDKMKFFAPGPVSVHDLADNAKVVTDNLVGARAREKDALREARCAIVRLSQSGLSRGHDLYDR
jgi:hypothetical protein